MKRLALCAVLLGLAGCGLNDAGGGSMPNPVAQDTTAPSAPSNLVATPVSPGRVVLAWDPSGDGQGSGVAGYRIYRNGSDQPIGSSSTPGYTDDAVIPGMTYLYQVRAFDSALVPNVSNPSLTATAVTPNEPVTPTAPSVPEGLAARANSPTSVSVSWSASVDGGSGVGGYRLYRDGSDSAIAVLSGTSFEDASVVAATTYSYRVLAFDATAQQNASALSAPASVMTPAASPPVDATPPTAPTNLTAVAPSQDRVELAWTGSSDAGGSGVGGYRVFRDGGLLATVTTTGYADADVSPGTSYSYVVRAFDLAPAPNLSDPSNTANVTTPATPPPPDTTPPTVPANLSASAPAWNRVELQWSASSDAGAGVAGYRVLRGGAQIAVVATPAHVDTSVAANTSYAYTVVAFDAATPPNASAPSASASVTTPAEPDTTAPSVPGGVTATAQSPTLVRVSWNASTDDRAGTITYRVWRNGALLGTTTQPRYDDAGATADTTYGYAISALDAATPPNESARSPPVSVTTPPLEEPDTTAPSVPGNLAASASPSSVRLTWSASTDDAGGAGVAGYRIYRDGVVTPIASTSSTAWTDNGVAPETAYTYYVSAYDAAVPENESALSPPADVTTPAVPDTTPPSVPQGLTVRADNETQVTLAWSPSTDGGGGSVAGYRVLRGGVQVAQVAVPGYVDTGVVASTTYQYSIVAFDTASPPNASAASAAVSITTPAAPDRTAPTVPAGVTAVAPIATEVRVSWAASTDTGGSGLAGYRLHRNGAATPLATLPAGATSYLDATVTASTAYTYQLSAYDNAGNASALSAAANVTTPQVLTSGLDARPSNTQCVAGAEPAPGTLGVNRVFPNLDFIAPVQMLQAPGDSGRWFVVQQSGSVRVFPNSQSARNQDASDFLVRNVLFAGESGLLGIAFHPDYPADRRLFVFYINASPWQSRVSVYRVNAAGTAVEAGSETVLLSIPRSQDNHNGGQIAFGPDRLLYIGTGDGGGANDDNHGPIGNGQNIQTLLGKMLRIDVGGASSTTYTIPADNPFATNGGSCTTGSTADTDGCREIYAFGLRNPWRWSFDRTSGELWVADVGQGTWEEVNKVVRGGNYGWRCREGANDFLPQPSDCGTRMPRLDPVVQYDHGSGRSITGGFVYRGSAMPSVAGRYFFGDFDTGRIWHVAASTTPTLTVNAQTPGSFSSNLAISAFGEGNDGELYVVDVAAGTLHQIVQRSAGGGGVADRLSATGCAAAGNLQQPSSGMVPFEPNAPFWSDDAAKSRWLALPDGTTINTSASDGDWNLPNGSVLRKDFRIGSRLVETRLFMRHTNGNWAGYTYEWNSAQNEALRVTGGKQVRVNGQDWIIPSEAQCLACHTQAAGRSLGLETAQLNGDMLYPATGRTANQVHTLGHIGVLNPVIAVTGATPKFPDPYDAASGTTTARARAWLHTNCSFCHRPGGPTPSSLDLRYATALAATNACNTLPQNGDLGLPNARLIAPGAPGSSVLLDRIDRRDARQMPPLASLQVDDAGVQLITSWISGLSGCN